MKRFINELKYLNRGMPTSTKIILGVIVAYILLKYSLQGTTQGNGLTGGLPPVRFSM